MDKLQDFPVKDFTDTLLSWFDEHKRNLPWRNKPTPYHVWISEIMLQQTQVNTVIPYFKAFIEKFPTIQSLAEADEEQVLKAWEGLGYYSRARNLHEAAKTIMSRFNGEFPTNYEDVLSLKGIGTYTAGAIVSMAFGIKAPAVDGNVMRVMSRILLITEDIASHRTKRLFEDVMMEVVPEDRPGAFNQSLMDLGAAICTPRSPKCEWCPVNDYCRAFANGVQEQLPVKTKKSKPKTIPIVTTIIMDSEGRVLMNKRPETGLLANLWEFLQFEGKTVSDLADLILQLFSGQFEEGEFLGTIKHVFSHRIWEMNVYLIRTYTNFEVPSEMAWYTREELDRIPISTAHKKVLERLEEYLHQN